MFESKSVATRKTKEKNFRTIFLMDIPYMRSRNQSCNSEGSDLQLSLLLQGHVFFLFQDMSFPETPQFPCLFEITQRGSESIYLAYILVYGYPMTKMHSHSNMCDCA